MPEAVIPDENYRCWPSYHHKGCLLSVFDVNEAIEICDSYSQCKAFVLTNQTTWTGRSWMLWSRTGSPILAALSVLIQLEECIVLGCGSQEQHLGVR